MDITEINLDSINSSNVQISKLDNEDFGVDTDNSL